MTERWAPGDVTLCVIADPWINLVTDEISNGPARGSIGEVVRVTVFDGKTMLRLARWPGLWCDATCFRKIEPLTPQDHREFVAVLAEDQRRKVVR